MLEGRVVWRRRVRLGTPAIQNDLYTIASGSVRHKAGKTGLITLYCPIAPTITINGGSFGGWFMTFVDPDGAGNNYYIQSQIIRSDQSGHVGAVSPPMRSSSPSGLRFNAPILSDRVTISINHLPNSVSAWGSCFPRYTRSAKM